MSVSLWFTNILIHQILRLEYGADESKISAVSSILAEVSFFL
jgi:hypothetical protein